MARSGTVKKARERLAHLVSISGSNKRSNRASAVQNLKRCYCCSRVILSGPGGFFFFLELGPGPKGQKMRGKKCKSCKSCCIGHRKLNPNFANRQQVKTALLRRCVLKSRHSAHKDDIKVTERRKMTLEAGGKLQCHRRTGVVWVYHCTCSNSFQFSCHPLSTCSALRQKCGGALESALQQQRATDSVRRKTHGAQR